MTFKDIFKSDFLSIFKSSFFSSTYSHGIINLPIFS